MHLSFVDTEEEILAVKRVARHVSPHLHNALEIVWVTEGALELGVGQELYHMENGDIGFVFPNIIHHYQVFTNRESVAVFIKSPPFVLSTFDEILLNYAPEYPIIKAGDVDDLIYQTVAYVSGNFKNTFSLEDMAKDLGVSKYVLSRIFSKTFHSNFKQYLNDTRLDYARHRLENTEDSITNICLDSGFDSQRTFNRVFKERFRVSPTEYRKSQKEKVKLL